MEKDAVIGIIITIAAVTALTGLVCWSIRRINKIAKAKLRTARQTLRKLNSDG